MSAALVCAFVLALGTPVVWLLRSALGPYPIIALPALAFTFGSALWAAAAAIGYFAGLHLAMVAGLAVLLALAIFIIALGRTGERSTLLSIDGLQVATLFPVIIFVAVTALIGPNNSLSSDAIHHLIYVENFARSALFDYGNFELSHTVPWDVLFSAYAGNAYHGLLALPALLIEGGGEAAYRGINPWIALLLVSALYGLAHRLGGKRDGALAGFIAGGLIFVLFLGNSALVFGKWAPPTLAYPNHVGAVPALVALAIAIRAMERNSALSLRLATGLAIAGIIGVHLQWFLYTAIAIGLFAGIRLAVGPARLSFFRHGLPTALATLVASVVIGYPRIAPYMTNVESVAAAGTPGTLERFVVDTAMGKVVTPWAFTSAGALLALGASLLLIALSWRQRAQATADGDQSRNAFLFAAMTLGFALLMVMPIVTEFLMAMASPIIVGRMMMMVQCLGVVATGLAVPMLLASVLPWFARAFERRPGQLGLGAVATAVAAYAFILSAWPSSVGFWELRSEKRVASGHISFEQILDDPDVSGLLKSIPGDSRLLLIQPSFVKQVHLIRSEARMVQPVYRLDPGSRAVFEGLAPVLEGPTPATSFAAVSRDYDIDSVLAWEWPEQTEDIFIGKRGFDLQGEAAIERPAKSPVILRWYRYDKETDQQ
ncbi:MAG: hypothetical protein ACR2RE_21715 [Geminicoccaceae bacterium]